MTDAVSPHRGVRANLEQTWCSNGLDHYAPCAWTLSAKVYTSRVVHANRAPESDGSSRHGQPMTLTFHRPRATSGTTRGIMGVLTPERIMQELPMLPTRREESGQDHW